MSKSGLHDFTLVLVKENPASLIVRETPQGESFALPKSQIEFVPARKQGYVEVTMPEWLAQEKELI